MKCICRLCVLVAWTRIKCVGVGRGVSEVNLSPLSTLRWTRVEACKWEAVGVGVRGLRWDGGQGAKCSVCLHLSLCASLSLSLCF